LESIWRVLVQGYSVEKKMRKFLKQYVLRMSVLVATPVAILNFMNSFTAGRNIPGMSWKSM
jgi:hypothetical protein